MKNILVEEIMLFTDGSVDTNSNIGIGAYLLVIDSEISIDNLSKLVQLKQFENTSSTKLELEILLWALNEIQITDKKIFVYTDSQNTVGLPGRRKRFEQNDYRTKKNERIKNYKLYKEFYRICDILNCEFIKVRGHQKSHQKDDIQKIFTLVDRASRKALREEK
jgi:ribonuclease HI